MSEDKFDELIKGKLDQFSPVTGEDVWAAFELAREADSNHISEIEDLSFDELIKSQISTHTFPYQSKHWRIFQDQLKTIQERKQTVFISKILESVAIFLILLTFIHLTGLSDTFDFDPKLIQENNIYANSDLPTLQNSNFGIPKAVKEELASEIFTSIPRKPIDKTNNDIDVKLNSILEKGISTYSFNNNNNNFDAGQLIIDLQKKEFIEINNETVNLYDTQNVEKVESISASLLDLPESEYALSFPLKFEPVKEHPTYLLSIYGTEDINLINTPFDKLYSIASYNKEALNNSYGINIGRKLDKMELETGIGYSNRVYQPAVIREAFGSFADHYFEKSLKKINYDIVNIPLNLKYHFIDHSGWNAYVMLGAALNLVMNADYDINETLLQGRPSPDRYTPTEARLDEKPFIRGILNDGNFKDHYFASVGFGFGIEKKLFNKTSIYIQPSYQRHVLSADIGIGPNKDKIHTSSLQFGVKTILN